ncbi:hypothetical protein HED50_22675 [Ochrobactrum oryzae]|nr:hypothetical protein [Brucella oryzae]
MIKTALDRRVSLALEGEVIERRLSELRGMPYVVLLGEPELENPPRSNMKQIRKRRASDLP